jgi:MFS family permease
LEGPGESAPSFGGREARAFVSLFAATMVGLLAVGALFPVLPQYVKGPLGGDDVLVGVVIGAYAITGLAFRPIAGRFADRRGRKWALILGALLSAAAGAVLFLPLGLIAVLASRLLLGAGEGSVFTAGSAWVADMTPVGRRARMIGLYGLAIWSGLTIGPAIGELLRSAGGYELVWAFVFVAPLVSVMIASLAPEDYRPGASGSEEGQQAGQLISREALGPGLSMALGSAGFAAIISFIVLHLDAEGIGSGVVVFTAFAITLVLTRLVGGGLPDRLGARPVAAVAAMLEAIGLGLIAVGQTFPVVMLGAIVMGMAFSVLYPSLSLIVLNRVQVSSRGAAMGTFTAFFDLGIALGAPGIGVIVALGGYRAGFAFAALLALAVASIQGSILLGRSRRLA